MDISSPSVQTTFHSDNIMTIRNSQLSAIVILNIVIANLLAVKCEPTYAEIQILLFKHYAFTKLVFLSQIYRLKLVFFPFVV